MRKTICDICGKQIDDENDVRSVEVGAGDGVDEERGPYIEFYEWDACMACAERIAKEIDPLATPEREYMIDSIIGMHLGEM